MRHPDTVYRGQRVHEGGRYVGVTVTWSAGPDGPEYRLPLTPSLKVRCASPSGFEWGYGGSGPTQLALALLLDATGDPSLAERCCHWFKWATVAVWGESWSITAGEIARWVERWRREDLAAGTLAREGGAAHG